MKETEFQHIIRKTGRKPISCKCTLCKKQCEGNCCLGTPTDIEKIIDAGHGDKILVTDWAAGLLMGSDIGVIEMYQALFIKGHGCVFYIDGLCTLHDSGLKPTEGKLSHHSTKIDNFTARKSIAMNVAKTWLDPENAPIIERIKTKLNNL